jgi:peptide/nickel transport system substrate-binding protein
MKDLWRALQRRIHLKIFDDAEDTVRHLGRGGRALFFFFVGLLVLSAVGLLYIVEAEIVVPVPAYGGELTEGIVGSPRFINPVLAISDADNDLTSLVYSGLLKATPTGTYIPDLAESYDVSQDGLTYTVHMRPDATFQDGTPVTADDVIFTVEKVQDQALKSPVYADWVGVTATEVDSHTVTFTLKTPYAPFVQNLTLGILPKALWQDVSDDEFPFSNLNTNPIGSGPYKVSGIGRGSDGVPSSYTLTAFNNYALGEPYLTTLTFRFYQSEDALTSALSQGQVEAGSGISPEALGSVSGLQVETAPLNRVFGVFFNQNQSVVLRDVAVRQALNDAIDRSDLVQKVLGGYGVPLDGPIPPSLLNGAAEAPQSATSSDALAAQAEQELIKDGWVLNSAGVLQKTTGKGSSATTETRSFDLSTADVPELRAAAEYLKEQWAKMGASVNIQIFEQGDLTQNVIEPRKYDALLFGEVVGREPDLFAFWDSSQRNDPGLNIAMYANTAADAALEDMRTTNDSAQQAKDYQTFETQLASDVPAVFLYAPDFVYTVPNDLLGLTLGLIETPSDRFLSVTQWHRQVDYVWPFFATQR